MGGQAPDGNNSEPAVQTPTSAQYPPGVRHSGPQLPPIGYNNPGGGQVPGQYPAGSDGMYPQSNGQMYSTYPNSPYHQGGQVYPQRAYLVPELVGSGG